MHVTTLTAADLTAYRGLMLEAFGTTSGLKGKVHMSLALPNLLAAA